MNNTSFMSENVNEIMSALSKAQGKIQTAAKDKSNPYYKSKYADLASVWGACREALSENGLAVTQTIQQKPEGISLITTLGHSSGQWIKSEMPVIFSKNDPQTIGSAITYYRRYSLSAIVGVAADDDDDGEKAQAPYRSQKSEHNKSIKKTQEKEIEEIQKILERCDPAYKDWVFDYIKKSLKTESLNDLSPDVLEKIKAAALKHIKENSSQKELDPLSSEAP